MKKFKESFSERGQSGAVFRLLIDSIVGLAILVMILGALFYFETLNASASRQEFFSKVTAAVNSPNGIVVESTGRLVFHKGGFSNGDMESLTGYPKDCFEFQSNLAFAKAPTGEIIEFTGNIKSKVYVQCVTTGNDCSVEEEQDAGCCEIECLISFGKNIESLVDYE
jgi:hypothetical protein